MEPLLLLQPIHESSSDILRCLSNGIPLSADQLNFLASHEHELSNKIYDPIIKYYLESLKKRKRDVQSAFLLPYEITNRESLEQLKKRIQDMLEKSRQVILRLSPMQYDSFKNILDQEVHYWHSNQFVFNRIASTPSILYFQWGRLFGVITYVAIPAGKILKSDLIIYFENTNNRDLNTCVAEYKHRLENEILLQENIITESLVTQPHIPELKLANYYLINHLK